MSQKFASDYIDVATRIAEIRGDAERIYPEGSFQPFAPWQIVEAGGQTFVAYTAAFYRTPDDPRPGVGTAWEPVPGKTNFTRDSELQNAETSAWGRALIACLAADTKRGIASADEVRNRQSVEPTKVPLPDELAARLDALPEEARDRLVAWASRSGEPNIRLVPEPWVAAVERAVSAEESKLEPTEKPPLQKRAEEIGAEARARRDPSRKDAAAGDAA